MILCLFPLLFSMSAIAQESSVRISDIPTQEDTSVIIKKGASSCGPDFEVVSGLDEVAGDPSSGSKESYGSWKSACEAWKKDTRQMNKENQVLSLNCNFPTLIRLNSGLNIYHSSASYKLKIRIRNAH
ncbi:MAG: hypothetical protein ABI041_20190 [Bdellovibrionia bacterium]